MLGLFFEQTVVGLFVGICNNSKKIFPFRNLVYICSPKKQLLKKEFFNGKS